ncbi:glycosyltransferase [Paenibacillus tyrfis]|uniref:glycosyltransferase n=1 Tax=Paenibacillus tyrfis TaxID=1501230 RepID=UPI00209DE1DD|nr:glycosyltransferase [Paenibacillus tyrfis]MCP1309710.1 glycosyltransferase [Paenibacillus tyrfis]
METRKENLKKIIYVTHDANLNGAQLLSLHIIKTLKLGFHYEIEILCISGGPLVEEYEKYGIVSVLTNETEESILKIIQNLKSQGYEKAICNTVISGGLVKLLSDSRIDVISLIHELPGVIKQYSAQKKASFIAQYADKIIFPSNYVYEKFLSITDINEQKCVIQPQGLYKKNDYKAHIKLAREEIRSALNLSPDVKIVLGVGYADHRKGIDLFAEAAAITRSMNQKIVFVWVGNRDIHYLSELKEEHLNNVVFVDQTSEIGKYYAAADIYLLTSREDPFPSVVLEAFDVSIPVIGFKDAGGFVDIVSEKTGQLVEHSNVQELVRVLNDLLKDDPLRLELGREARCLVEQNFDFSKYVYKLLELLGHEYKKVSVVLPNYNYSKYLKERLDSICSQRYPIYELIILDDCSTDQSVNVIKKYLETNVLDSKMKISFVVNETNSGSVFKQWAKGINMAQGDYIWIAEADDLCSNQFLDGAMKGFHLDPSVVLSYTQSRQIDENGNTLAENYLDYTKEIDAEKWAGDYLDTGENEIKYRLYVKNTIPNVSAVVFKKYPINEILEDLQSFKIAGDWLFYIWLLKKGKMYFNHQSLNDHRRHTASVTKSENQQRHYDEVVKMQDYIIEQFGITPERKIKINDYRKFLKEYLLLN